MAQEQSSLRQAVDRILGSPGGSPTYSSQQGGPVSLAPRMPFSGLGTTSAISNAPVASPAAFATVPAVAPVPTKTYEQYTAEQRARNPGTTVPDSLLGLGYRVYQTNVAPLPATPLSKEAYTANQIQYGVSKEAMTPQLQDIGYRSYLTGYQNRGGTVPADVMAASATIRPLASPAGATIRTLSPAGSSALINPGPRVPWQASQQYWRDLAAQGK